MGAAWLLLVHQLPPSATSLRVRTWRRLQELGAVSLRNSVWVLPASDQAREDFEWIKREIESAKEGGAMVFAADSVDRLSNDEVIAAFKEARAGEYRALAGDAARMARRVHRAGGRGGLLRQIRQIEERLTRLDAIAFFPPPDRDKTAAAVAALKAAARSAAPRAESRAPGRLTIARYARRTWVTRPRPGIDRMSSAWLIRRFVDPRGRFHFSETLPRAGSAVPFDMFGAEFGHTGSMCTFETLADRFGIDHPAVAAIGEIVHDLDLKEDRYSRPEGPAFGRLVEGLRAIYDDDRRLLIQGMVLFEALYRSLGSTPERRRARRPLH